MTTEEAINELILNVGYLIEEIEQHEEFKDQEQGEFQIQSYERIKRELEAYTVIFGALDPSLSTVEGLRDRCEKVREKEYGSSCSFYCPEPSEIESELYNVLNPWYQEAVKENGGHGTEFDDLSDDEQHELARINLKDHEHYEDPIASEEDRFAFYPYRGRIAVIYNEYADCDFLSFSEEFQEKALEFVKKHLEDGA